MPVRVESRERVTVVTIDRPERRNAVDAETAAALARAFREFDADTDARVAVLTGAGADFCAGADLRAIAEGRSLRVEAGDDGPMGPTRMRLGKPVIAAIEGYCVAGGLELALWCDLRVAGREARLGVLNRRFGVPLVDGGTIRLARIAGQGLAMDMVLTGRLVEAPEALAHALVNRVVEPSHALEAAVAMAGELAEFPQAGMRHDRLSLLEQWDLGGDAAMANELEHGLAALASGEAVAGAEAFTAGRGRHGAPRRVESDAPAV